MAWEVIALGLGLALMLIEVAILLNRIANLERSLEATKAAVDMLAAASNLSLEVRYQIRSVLDRRYP